MNHLNEEDELLEEIDVYFCGELSEELAVFQYPLRPNDRFYGDYGGLTSATVNKENTNLKFNYTIDNKMKNFDTQYYTGKNFSQVLLGQKIDANTNYCVGLFRNNSLFINPVQNFIQFRNDFSHLEVNESLNKKVKDKQIQRKESIGNYIEGQKENTWANLKIYKTDSLQSYQILDKLFFEEESTRINNLEFLSNKEYQKLFFDNVNREVLVEKLSQRFGSERVNSYRELIEQPLPVKIEYIIKKIQVINFYVLKKYCLEEATSDKIFLENCLKYANILKNGNLILKSELRYDPNTKKDMIVKRNYMVNLLQNSNEGIKRSDIKFLDNSEINEILNDIAYTHQGNIFLKENLTDNKNFILKFEKIYSHEINQWDSINIKKQPVNGTSISNGPANSQKPPTANNSSATPTKSTTPITSVETEDKNDIPEKKKTSLSNKINIDILKSSIIQAFTRKDVYYVNELIESILINFNIEDNEENKDIVNIIKNNCEEMCINVNNRAYFLKEVGEGDFNLARKKIFELLISKQSCKKAEIKTHLDANNITITDSMLNKLLKNVGVYASNYWQLKEPSS